jgi:UDP-3-O-[3-hydroxymyristoyl] glucosamine N-acyltransferase
LKQAQNSDALLLVDSSLASFFPKAQCWTHPFAAYVLACLLQELLPKTPCSQLGVVSPLARVADNVSIQPGAVLMDHCEVGPDSLVGPNAVIYGGVRIGSRVVVGANAVLGRQGFGWVSGPNGQLKRMPQLGGVIIEDDVEIGPLSTVDCGTLEPTILERGCKLDAHVHVGHNVRIGAWTLVAAQAGFAGSSRIGSGVLVGGQAGVGDHIRVGNGARLAGKAGVISDVDENATVAGYPAVNRMTWLRAMAKLFKGRKQ